MENSRICKNICYVLHLSITTFVFIKLICISTSTAGDCWGKRHNSYNTCRTLLKQNVSKNECCSKYTGEGISWTNETFSFSDIFKYTNLYNGIPNCTACRGESGSDSCDDIDCGNVDKKCIMKNNKPKCVCSPNCSKAIEEPKGVVCGTDFNEYNHKCAMLKEACRSGENVALNYYGYCEDSCEDVICPEEKRCVEVQNAKPLCVSCNMPCPPPKTDDDYVCGNDSLTYESQCQLKQEACLRNEAVEVVNEGQCENLSSCDELSCVEKNGCVMDDGVPRCVLCDFECTGWRSNYLVCADDEYTYDNWCHLREHICNTSQYIEMRGFGTCGGDDLYEIEEGMEGSAIDDNSDLFLQLFSRFDEENDLNSTQASNETIYNTTTSATEVEENVNQEFEEEGSVVNL